MTKNYYFPIPNSANCRFGKLSSDQKSIFLLIESGEQKKKKKRRSPSKKFHPWTLKCSKYFFIFWARNIQELFFWTDHWRKQLSAKFSFILSRNWPVHILLKLSNIGPKLGNGCSTVVEYTPHDPENVGLKPDGTCLFLFFSLLGP